ncbi:MAG: EAL domain-containing protein [Gammaproteobacteria bacterium]|nr:MAG: EAL domain-containing protein [Gammaproteobacteria bacterium]
MPQRARYTRVFAPGEGFLGRMAMWEWDARSNTFTCHGQLASLEQLGAPRPRTLEELIERVPRAERGEFREWLEAARQGREPGPLEHHLLAGPNRGQLLVGHVIEAKRDAQGGLVQLQGVVVDLSRVRRLEQRSRILGQALEQAWEEFYLFSPHDLRFVEVNAAASQHTGYSREELRGLTPLDLKRDFDETRFRDFLDSLQSRQKRLVSFTTRHYRKDGSSYPVEVRLQYIGLTGEALFSATVADLSAQETFNRSLGALEERLRHIMAVSPMVHYSCRLQGERFVPTFVSQRLEDLGYRPDEVIGNEHWWYNRVHPEDRERVLRGLVSVLEDPDQARHVHEYRFRRGDGSWIWIHDELAIVRDARGQPVEIVGNWLDISERQRLREALERRSLYDELTGLANRALCHDRLEQAIHAAREHGETLTLVLVDLARLKHINDAHGFDTGDLALVEVAARLLGFAGEDDSVARVGGDTFALILRETDREAAEGQVRGILDLFEQSVRLGEHELMLDVVLGVAIHPPDGTDAETLLRHADVALNEAKELGLEHCFYDQVMGRSARSSMNLVADLRHALGNGGDGLDLHVQPKLRLSDGRIIGGEALARWYHPERGEISPAEFVELAERHRMIHRLTGWVLQRALYTLDEWAGDGWPLHLAVNFSALDLGERALLDEMSQRLAATGLPAERLQVEITETALMREMEPVRKALEEIKALGVTIAIDDFGTGYSSLAYLRSLPVDCIKIDASFVRLMDQSREDMLMVRHIVNMAHDLGLQVIAEGVENAAILELLREMGCDQAQGYYIARPMPLGKFSQWLQGLPKDAEGYPVYPLADTT